MRTSEKIVELESNLYNYNLKAFSEQFVTLLDYIEMIFVESNGEKKKELADLIGKMYLAYNSKDYLYALEITKYEMDLGDL